VCCAIAVDLVGWRWFASLGVGEEAARFGNASFCPPWAASIAKSAT
jgi:hypothetical protein